MKKRKRSNSNCLAPIELFKCPLVGFPPSDSIVVIPIDAQLS